MTFFWVFLKTRGGNFWNSGDTKKVCAEMSKFWCFFESRKMVISKKPNPECSFFCLPSLLFLRNGEEGLFNTCHFFGFFDIPGIDVFGVGISRFGWTNFGGGVSKNAKKWPPRGKKVLPRGYLGNAWGGVFCEIEGLAEGRLDPPILFGTVFPQFGEQGGGPGGCGKKVQEIPAKMEA